MSGITMPVYQQQCHQHLDSRLDHEDGDTAVVDEPSIIHLLRVFVGAVEDPPLELQDHQNPPLQEAKEKGKGEASSVSSRSTPQSASPPASPSHKKARNNDSDSHSKNNESPDRSNTVSSEGRAVRAHARARTDAGCTLWDLSVSEAHAAVMCSAGLIPVTSAVLQHCDDAESRVGNARVMRTMEDGRPEMEDAEAPVAVASHGAGQQDGVRAGIEVTGGSAESGGVSLGVPEAVRLREITCGLLANVCAHRSLRAHIAVDAPLSEQLLLAFHSSDDPACLTEVLRLFASAAAACLGGAKEGGRLGAGLVARETLERLVFFLENSLEEKLLARACALLYAIMYRCGDQVIGPLIFYSGVEGSLASLLNTRMSDLSYEQVGGGETGLDSLLRCLEVLSTSDISSIGPSMRHVSPNQVGGADSSQVDPDTPTSFNSAVTPPVAACLSPVGGSQRAQESRACAAPSANDKSAPDVVARTSNARVTPQATRVSCQAASAQGNAEGVSGAGGGAAGAEAVKTAVAVVEGGGGEGRPPATVQPNTAILSGRYSGGVSREASGVRDGIIRGLVRALVPWEHSRRSQEAALIVLGNVLESAEDCGDPRVRHACVMGLEDELVVITGSAEGEEEDEGKWRGDGSFDGGRLARKRRDFLDNVEELAGAEDESRGADKELRLQLREASATLTRALLAANRSKISATSSSS